MSGIKSFQLTRLKIVSEWQIGDTWIRFKFCTFHPILHLSISENKNGELWPNGRSEFLIIHTVLKSEKEVLRKKVCCENFKSAL